MSKTVLIVGAGIAGLTAAKAAVKQGWRVVLAGSEPYLPYYRPRLIEVLAAELSVDALLIQKAEWFKTSGIEVMLSARMQGLDADNKTAMFSDGRRVCYDKLILACGALANKPALPVDGSVFTLHSYDDALAIKSACIESGRAFIVGGGILGLEIAFALRKRGISVSVAEREEYLLPRQLDRPGGAFLKGRLEQAGIKIHVSADCLALRHEMQQAVVIAASGITPEIAFLKNSVIAANRGIVVDETMKTNLPDVFACGDMAEFNSCVPGLMLVAAKQGETAGLSACGAQAVYSQPVLSPVLKIADIAVMSVGSLVTGENTMVLRDQTESGYRAAVLENGRLKGAALIGNTSSGTKLKAAIENKMDFAGATKFDDLLL